MNPRWSRIPWVLIVALLGLLMSGSHLSRPTPTLAVGTGQIYVSEDTQILRVNDVTGTGRITWAPGAPALIGLMAPAESSWMGQTGYMWQNTVTIGLCG